MARYHRKRKSMKGGDDGTGPGTTQPETKGYSNGATNPNEDAANAATADNDNLNNLNNIQQSGGRCKNCGHKHHGGSSCENHQYGGNASDGQVKAVSVDSPAREIAAGPYSSQNQVTANQEVANQGAENTKYDNPGPAPQGGGKRRRKSRKSTRKKSKSKKSMKKRRGRKTIKKSRSRRSRR